MNKINYLLSLLLIFSLVVFGCTQESKTPTIEKKDLMMEKDAILNDGTKVMTDGEMTEEKKGMMSSSYIGKVLAGTEKTNYLDFSKADYDSALKEKKKILLYFYANWCPICKKEQPEAFAAFNELNDSDLIGFRVNYRDSDTDSYEEALAKEFGVSYQHTKVILKNGKRVGKFPDSWDKQRYLDELAKI